MANTAMNLCDCMNILNRIVHKGSVIIAPGEDVILKMKMDYNIHLRPVGYLLNKAGLIRKPYIKRLSIKMADDEDDIWRAMDTFSSFITLPAKKGDEILIKYSTKHNSKNKGCSDIMIAKELKEVVNIFESFLHSAEYKQIRDENKLKIDDDEDETRFESFERSIDQLTLESLRDNFDSPKQEYSLIKLNIENLIFSQLIRIENSIITDHHSKTVDWEAIDDDFKKILIPEKNSNIALHTLNTAYDNLLQTRDMCYALHHRQVTEGKKLNYRKFYSNWIEDNAKKWRDSQNIRNEYFYERESEYYRDLFLVLLLRERPRLEAFHSNPERINRLDHSIELRKDISSHLINIKGELSEFKSNFENEDEFIKSIDIECKEIKRKISMYDGCVNAVKDKNLYMSEYGTKDCPNKENCPNK